MLIISGNNHQLARKTRSGRKEVFESLSETCSHEKPLTPCELNSGETSELLQGYEGTHESEESDRFSEHELTLTELETDELNKNDEDDQSLLLTEITEPVSRQDGRQRCRF